MNNQKQLDAALVQEYVSLKENKERALRKAEYGYGCDEDPFFQPEDISEIWAGACAYAESCDIELEKLLLAIGATEEEILRAARA